MEELLSNLTGISITRGQLMLVGILIAVTLSVFSLGFVLSGVRSNINRRVDDLSDPEVKRQGSKVKDTLESISPLYMPKSGKERENIRHQLMHAGLHQKSAIANFYALKLLSFVVSLVVAGVLYLTLNDSSMLNFYLACVVFAGLFLPNIILRKKGKARQNKIRRGIPDALDLLVVCTESGLGFLAALRRVADEIYISHPELGDELETICVKVKTGVEIPTAFEEMITRTGLTELAGLVSMLSHASRIGGSISDTLREYTEDYRDKRNQAAEEIAAKIPTKMMFPMFLFIWPCFFIVAIGPSILIILKNFE
ncbi:type II secretion system F family protein [Vibrio barjaei]|uniref:Type II secretion system F family protein n=1 Tax=Vibrio barjaei TaxID=1676683 RepID=A0ABW7IHI1_9VIBR|nr:type II secretion system F family protein [Vibrio barjaei]MCY9873304.1 type II secretion system F family protein [Vibrio barjaei]OIN25716.1 pilus assembly protein TadC [Vibrio barjaei]